MIYDPLRAAIYFMRTRPPLAFGGGRVRAKTAGPAAFADRPEGFFIIISRGGVFPGRGGRNLQAAVCK